VEIELGGIRWEPVPAFGILYELAEDPSIRSFFMWGGRGGAKSTAMAQFFAHRAAMDAGTFLCTREVQNSLAESVYGSIKDAIANLGIPGYRITETNFTHPCGSRTIFAGLGYREGIHVKSTTNIIRCWVEEAQQVSHKSLQVLIPTVRQPGSKLYYAFNRTDPRDPIWDLWTSHRTKSENQYARFDGIPLKWVLHRGDGAVGIEINWDGNPFFPDVLDNDRRQAYRIAQETGRWAEYNHVWEGVPLDTSNLAIMTTDQVAAAMKREASDEGAVEVGADIARGGKDRVVFVKRKGLKMLSKRVYQNNDPGEKMRITETAERLMAFIGPDKDALVKVDDTGLGGGVTDILEDKGYNVEGVNFGARAVDYDHYTNVAAELWFNFAQIVDKVELLDDAELAEELYGRREGRRDNRGRRTVERKDDFNERLGRSPDLADATLLAFYEPGTVVREINWALA
jgi:phage terminase large subunit